MAEDWNWRLWYRSLLIRSNVPVLASVPQKLECVDSLEILLVTMKRCPVCPGHSDFPMLADSCEKQGNNVLTGHSKDKMVGFYHCGTFHSHNCHVLSENTDVLCLPSAILCPGCAQPDFRQSIRSRESHLRKRDMQGSEYKVQANSKTPFCHLTLGQKDTRLKNLSKAAQNLKHKVKRTEAKVDKILNNESVELSPEQSAFVCKVTKENGSLVAEVYPEGSPQRLLWEQQVKRNNVKDPGGMRWHPTIICWCLSMHLKSPAAYNQLAKSGFLHLPSQYTLKTYSNFSENMPGVNPEILRLLVKEMNLPAAPAFQRNVCLVWDEMKVPSGLVISKGAGRVIGFTSLDSISTELGKLSQLSSSKETEPELATHILVFMVRELMTSVNIPFIWYPCQGFSAEQLWGEVWGGYKDPAKFGTFGESLGV